MVNDRIITLLSYWRNVKCISTVDEWSFDSVVKSANAVAALVTCLEWYFSRWF
jgi:hypothetical protein